MKVHELNVRRNKSSKRVGRGISAGGGKTAGRGTKGQGARTGSKSKPGFEGGQNPLMQRLPKLRGFRSHKVVNELVYTGQLNSFKDKAKVDTYALAEAGIISSPFVSVKLIVKGELSKAITLSVQAASASAVDAMQKAGGSVEIVARQARPASTKKADKKA